MLSTLPHEILVAISDHLDTCRDISSLAKCCRRFHHLFHPQIYESLEFSGSSWWSISRLIRTLIENPSRAQHVSSLSLGYGSALEHGTEEGAIYEADILDPALERVCCSREERLDWSQKLQDADDPDPWQALLLTLLPSLQQLNILFEWPAEYTHRVLRRAALRSHPFDNIPLLFPDLREVSVDWWDTVNGVQSSSVLPFFRFPSVTSISGSMIIDDGEDIADTEPASSSSSPASGYSSVTAIDFDASNSGLGFPKLLNACAKLEHFSYLHADGAVGDSDFNPPVFFESLVRHKDSLQTLTLLFDTAAGHHPLGAESENAFLGSLRGFTSLRTIQLRAPNVLDVGDQRGALRTPLMEVLPSPLESLCLEDAGDCDIKLLLSQLEEVVGNARTTVPHLTSVEIAGRLHEQEPFNILAWASQPHYVAARRKVPTIKEEIVDAAARLRRLCSENCIDFQLRDPEIEAAIAHNKRWGHA